MVGCFSKPRLRCRARRQNVSIFWERDVTNPIQQGLFKKKKKKAKRLHSSHFLFRFSNHSSSVTIEITPIIFLLLHCWRLCFHPPAVEVWVRVGVLRSRDHRLPAGQRQEPFLVPISAESSCEVETSQDNRFKLDNNTKTIQSQDVCVATVTVWRVFRQFIEYSGCLFSVSFALFAKYLGLLCFCSIRASDNEIVYLLLLFLLLKFFDISIFVSVSCKWPWMHHPTCSQNLWLSWFCSYMNREKGLKKGHFLLDVIPHRSHRKVPLPRVSYHRGRWILF